MATTLTFKFTDDEVKELEKPANGQGGFQSLIKKLQGILDKQNGVLALTDAQIGTVVRYMSYKPGGFEGRLAAGFRRNLHGFID